MPKVRTSLVLTGIIIAMLAASILTVLGLFMSGLITLNKPVLELCAVEVNAREYDGTPLKAEEYEWVSGEDKLKEGHKYEVAILGEQVDCGTSESDLRVTIYDEKERDVTNEYSIKVTNCKLTVLPREVTIALEGQDVPYSGTEIFINKYKVYEGSVEDPSTQGDLKEKQLAAGEKLAISFPGFVNVGDELPQSTEWTDNNLIIYNEVGRVVTSNYHITPALLAPINIVPRKIGVKAFNAEKYYDGKPIALAYQLVGLAPVGNDYIKDLVLVDESGNPVKTEEIVKTGDSKKVRVVGLDIWRQNGYTPVPLTGAEANNYAFELVNEGEDEFVSLNILKRPVEVTAKDLIKEYDGLALSNLVSDDAPAYTVIGLLAQFTLSADCARLDEIKDVYDGNYSMSNITIQENGDDVTGEFEITSRAAVARITPVKLKVAPKEQELDYTGAEIEISLDEIIGENLGAAIADYLSSHVVVGQDLQDLFDALKENTATYFQVVSSVVMKNVGEYRFTAELSAEGMAQAKGNIIFEFTYAPLTVKAIAISVAYSGAVGGTITKIYDGRDAGLTHRDLIVDGEENLSVSAADFTYKYLGNNPNFVGNCAFVGKYSVSAENIRITRKAAEDDGTVFEDVTQNYKITIPALAVEISPAKLNAVASQAIVLYEVGSLSENNSTFRSKLADELRPSVTFVGLAAGDSVNYDLDTGFSLNASSGGDTIILSVSFDFTKMILNSNGDDVRDCYDFVNEDETIITVHLTVKA